MSFQTQPFASFTAVVPNDATVLAPTRAIYVGVAGDVAVDGYLLGTNVLFKALPVGRHDLEVTRIYATATTATNIVALR